MKNKAKEMIIKLRQCSGYPQSCSTCPEPERCKQIINQALHSLYELIYEKMPKPDNKQYGLPMIDKINEACNNIIFKQQDTLKEIFEEK